MYNYIAKKELSPKIEQVRQQLAVVNGFKKLGLEQVPAGRYFAGERGDANFCHGKPRTSG